jgi:exodeoxyribonuclease-3
MILACWNVNSIRVRLPQLLAWLHSAKPDVVCLQEIKVETDEFPFDALGAAGYEAAAHGQPGYNGVAILSRSPLEEIVPGFDGEEGQSRLIEARVGDVRVFSAYCPNGQSPTSDKFAYKERFYEALRAHLDSVARPDELIALCGDFNVAPEPRDVWDAKKCAGDIGFHPSEHQWLANLTGWGLVDSFRLHEQGAGHFSWWDYRGFGFGKNRGMRIDQIWLSRPLAERCTRAWIDVEPRKLEKPSDHTPVLCEFSV